MIKFIKFLNAFKNIKIDKIMFLLFVWPLT